MKTLTDKQYEEYKNLKRWAKREKVWVSVNGIKSLEDDIDLPVKKCVAMMALLGLEPMFSCCGFDYHGQPYHKSHEYGQPYFMFHENGINKQWLVAGGNGTVGMGWKIRKHVKGTLLMVNTVKGNPHWRKKDCIHFSEEVVLNISWLEKALLSLSNNFMDSIILADTNQNYKSAGVRYWQYPAKEPWVIKKELLDTY